MFGQNYRCIDVLGRGIILMFKYKRGRGTHGGTNCVNQQIERKNVLGQNYRCIYILGRGIILMFKYKRGRGTNGGTNCVNQQIEHKHVVGKTV